MALQAPFIRSLDYLMNQGGGGCETNRQPLLASGQPKAVRDVCLARSGWSQRDNVLSPTDELAMGELHRENLVSDGIVLKSKLSKLLVDLRRFMKLLEDDPSFLEPRSSFPIIRGNDNKWHKAKDIYLDSPLIDTALGDYFALLGAANRLVPPADIYQTLKFDNAKLTRFLEALGAQTKIKLIRMSCDQNPQKAYLHTAPGERYTNPIDRDYGMNKFGLLAKQKSERLSRLVWSTMTALRIPDSAYAENPLRAVYRKNERGGARFADSHLVHQLRSEEWIPQRGGQFVRPSDARSELLPDGFTFDAGWHWIKASKFGDGARLQSERARAASAAAVEQVRRDQEAATTLGFKNPEIARQLAEIPPEELSAIVAEHTRRKNFDLPDKEIGNTLRRSDRVTARALPI